MQEKTLGHQTSAELPHFGRLEGTSSPASAATQREQLSIQALYKEHFQFVWRNLRRLGVRPSNVDDAVQDVFLRAHRKLAEFEGRSSYKRWLFAISLRVASEYRRREGRLTLEEDPASFVAPHDNSVEVRSRVRLLYKLLDALSDEQREVFIMAEVEGFSAPEIAEVLGVKLNTVYSRLRLARSGFDQALRRHHKQFRSEVMP